MKHFCALLALLFMMGCKTPKTAVANQSNQPNKTVEQIIQKNLATQPSFKTLLIKADVAYKDNKQAQNVTAEIKIQKDKIILISIRFFGITMAKALITPTNVSYYEKINSQYFEGNFEKINQILGADFDFQKLQNLLIGNALYSLKAEDLDFSSLESDLILASKNDGIIQKKYIFEPSNFLLKQQSFIESNQNRILQIVYNDYTFFGESQFATSIAIDADQKSNKTNINLHYNSILKDEELNFPFAIPQGYSKINID